MTANASGASEKAAASGVRVRGGATLPSTSVWAFSASIPLAELLADEKGVVVRLRRGANAEAWSAAWPELERVLRGPRSLIFVPLTGRGCRFTVLSRAKAKLLAKLMADHGVTVEEVSTTIRRAFTV